MAKVATKNVQTKPNSTVPAGISKTYTLVANIKDYYF